MLQRNADATIRIFLVGLTVGGFGWPHLQAPSPGELYSVDAKVTNNSLFFVKSSKVAFTSGC